MLALENVHKTYTLKGVKKTVLDNQTFVFPEGRNVAIVGKNGAGKSTLMRLLAGSERPDRGRVWRDEGISWPLGFAGGFNGSMTGVENTQFVARLYGYDPKEVLAYVETFAELGDSLRLPIKTYSSGMKARLAFGMSMAIRFDTYLIDEVTSVGDERFRAKCKAVFAERVKTARVIMISHSASQIRESCDCGVHLHNGRIVYFEDIEALLKHHNSVLAQEHRHNRR